MQKSCKYKNNELKFSFSFSEREAYVLRTIMQKNIKSNSYLWERLASEIIDGIDDSFKTYQDKFQERNENNFNAEYICNWTK